MASSKYLRVLFWLLVATDIAGIVTNTPLIHFIAKPLLMPTLMAWLLTSIKLPKRKRLILAGLFTAWAGDVLLLFDKHGPIFFIAGLICFLLTHIFYIVYFLQLRSAETSLLKKQPWWILFVLAYGALLLWILFPHLKEMKLPVTIYAIVICTMLLCSLHVFNRTSQPSRWYFVFGAFLFVVSDSLLAINKFYQPFSYAGVLIMLSYCAAQYMIISGYIQQKS